MKFALFVGAVVAGLMILSIYDRERAATRPVVAAAACRAPESEGDLTMITIDVRAGRLYFDCEYATTRKSKRRDK